MLSGGDGQGGETGVEGVVQARLSPGATTTSSQQDYLNHFTFF